MSLPLRCRKARPRAGSCSPLSRSSWWDWKSGFSAASASRPRLHTGVPGEQLQPVPKPSSAPAVGLGAEANPLLSSPLPAASLARGGRNNWCVGGVGAAACALLCRAASLRLGTATTASLWPAAQLRTAKGRVGGTYPAPAPSRYAPITGVAREHPGGVCPPAVSLGLGRGDTGRGKDAGSICQRHGGGWLGRAGGSQHTPLCVLPQPLQLSLASSLAAGSGVGVPEPIW